MQSFEVSFIWFAFYKIEFIEILWHIIKHHKLFSRLGYGSMIKYVFLWKLKKYILNTLEIFSIIK